MAFGFVKKTWKDRISEYPTRRTLTKEDGSTELVTVSRSEGTVSQEGDAFSADNMNDLETRVDNALNEVNSNLLRISYIEYLKNFTVPTSKTVLDKMYTATKECFVIASINQQLANVTPTFTELSHSSNAMYKKNSGTSTATIALHLMPNDYIKITASAATAGVNTFSGTIIVIEK